MSKLLCDSQSVLLSFLGGRLRQEVFLILSLLVNDLCLRGSGKIGKIENLGTNINTSCSLVS